MEKDADGDEGVALRATFIISDRGIVRHAEIADLPIGRNPEETVRLVQAFKFADEHGEVNTARLLHSHAMCPRLSSRVARALCRLPRGSPAGRSAPLHGSPERRR